MDIIYGRPHSWCKFYKLRCQGENVPDQPCQSPPRQCKIHKKSDVVIGLDSWDFASTLRTPSPSPKTKDWEWKGNTSCPGRWLHRIFVDFTQARLPWTPVSQTTKEQNRNRGEPDVDVKVCSALLPYLLSASRRRRLRWLRSDDVAVVVSPILPRLFSNFPPSLSAECQVVENVIISSVAQRSSF